MVDHTLVEMLLKPLKRWQMQYALRSLDEPDTALDVEDMAELLEDLIDDLEAYLKEPTY